MRAAHTTVTLAISFMPASYAPQPPSRVGLFLGGLRYEVTEYSSAGLTLHRTALDASGLGSLRRGEPCPATLQVFGEMYAVTLRLAAQGPLHVEFAFVSLAAQARGALEHYARPDDVESEAFEPLDMEEAVSGTELPGPMALAFSRLAEPSIVPAGRRFIIPESKKVYAVTLERQAAPHPEPEAEPESLPELDAMAPLGEPSFGPRETFAYGITFIIAVALILLWIVA